MVIYLVDSGPVHSVHADNLTNTSTPSRFNFYHPTQYVRDLADWGPDGRLPGGFGPFVSGAWWQQYHSRDATESDWAVDVYLFQAECVTTLAGRCSA